MSVFFYTSRSDKIRRKQEFLSDYPYCSLLISLLNCRSGIENDAMAGLTSSTRNLVRVRNLSDHLLKPERTRSIGTKRLVGLMADHDVDDAWMNQILTACRRFACCFLFRN
jgi:hypothetical protein